MSEYLSSLNAAQRAAVENYKNPSLIVAGAGSGKTRVLTSRIAYMLEQGVEPYRILALTFTNKAAAEMRERIATLVGTARARSIWMGTFHSIFARILRAEAEKLGYPQSFTIYDASDARNVVKILIKEMELNDENYKPNEIMARISLAKNNLVVPEAYEANTNYIAEDRERKRPEFVELYKNYARKLKEYGAMDFDDLLLNVNILFRDHPDALAKYQQMFHYILVDEYQDTNYAQYIIIRRLAQHHSNVCVVGDDAQSIYSFRGARIENILRFKNDFKDAQTFKLEQNYRSTKTIVNAANSVIGKNLKQIKKESFSEGDEGDKILVMKAYTDQEEASMVADKLREFARDGEAQWSEMAILYRTNAQSRVMEEALRRRSVPYRIYGGMSFYARKEIKDLIGYIRLVVNPKDDEAFRRVINYPTRGIGGVTLDRVTAVAQEKGVSMWEAASGVDPEDKDMRGAGRKIASFVEMINALSVMRETSDVYQLGVEIATRSGIIGVHKMEQSPESMSALENIEELLNSMQTFKQQRDEEQEAVANGEYDESPNDGAPLGEASIEEWLQGVALLTDADKDDPEERDKVTLMTIHSAKGLEFKYVCVVGLEENLFPNLMGLGSPDGLEEERRLFYVALTRAEVAAVLSFSETRFKWGNMEFCRPSRFLSEIDQQYLDLNFELEDTTGASDGSDWKRTPKQGTVGGQHGNRESGGGYSAQPKGESGAPVRGEAARRWQSASGQKRAYGNREPKPVERIEVPTPDVGAGSRFRSVGNRLKTDHATPPGSHGSNYEVGMRVEHNKFGVGMIENMEEMAGDMKLTIDFGAGGKKVLLSKYAKLHIL